MNNELRIVDLIDVYLKRWWLILICGLVGGLITYFYSTTYITPTYVSRGSLYVSSKGTEVVSTQVNAGELQAAQKLAETLQIVLKSDRYMSIVKADSSVPYTVGQLKTMIKVTSVQGSEILEVTTSAPTPGSAQIITQSVLDNAKGEILRVIEFCSVKMIDDASYPNSQSSPNVRNNTLIGVLMGAGAICLLIMLLEFMDMTVKSPEILALTYNIPVVGSIPNLEVSKNSSYYNYTKPEEIKCVQ